MEWRFGESESRIMMIARRKSDDEVGEWEEEEKIEGEIEHVDGKAIGEPLLSEKRFTKWMAEMIGSTKLDHHLEYESSSLERW